MPALKPGAGMCGDPGEHGRDLTAKLPANWRLSDSPEGTTAP